MNYDANETLQKIVKKISQKIEEQVNRESFIYEDEDKNKYTIVILKLCSGQHIDPDNTGKFYPTGNMVINYEFTVKNNTDNMDAECKRIKEYLIQKFPK